MPDVSSSPTGSSGRLETLLFSTFTLVVQRDYASEGNRSNDDVQRVLRDLVALPAVSTPSMKKKMAPDSSDQGYDTLYIRGEGQSLSGESTSRLLAVRQLIVVSLCRIIGKVFHELPVVAF